MVLNHMRYRGYDHPKYARSLLTGKTVLHINRIANPLIKREKHILKNKYINYKNNEPPQATLFFANHI